MDEIQQPEGYRATTRRQFTFYYKVTGTSWYSFDRPWRDERLSRLEPVHCFRKNASS